LRAAKDFFVNSANQIDWKRLLYAFSVCGVVIAAAVLFDACG
jgi:hypothetical protein